MTIVLMLSFVGKAILRIALSRDLNYWWTGSGLYFEMAQNLIREGELYFYSGHHLFIPAKFYALHPPLFVFFVAAISKLTDSSASSFIVAQALVSILTVWIVYKIATRIANHRAGLLAAILYAFYPYAFVHDTQLQDTNLYNFLSLASIWCFIVSVDKKRTLLFFVTGLILGMTILVRFSHQTNCLFLVALLFLIFRTNYRRAFLFSGAVSLGILLCLSPWLIRNKRIIGSFAVTSRTGSALAYAHNEFTFRYYPYRGNMDQSAALFVSQLSPEQKQAIHRLDGDEVAQSRWYQALAMDYIRRHKFQTLLRGFYKAAVNFLGLLSPFQDPLKNVVYFFSYWFLTFLAIMSLPQVWKTTYFQTFLALSVSQAATSFIFFGHSSHRAFLDPMLAVLAGVGLLAWYNKTRLLVPLRRHKTFVQC